jgi:hypothetical protein
MALLATFNVSEAGGAPTFVAANAGGDTCAVPGGGAFIVAKNGSGAPITVTIADVQTPVPGGSAANNNSVVSVPAGAERWIALNPSRHLNPATGVANITYSGVTSLTVACINGPGR